MIVHNQNSSDTTYPSLLCFFLMFYFVDGIVYIFNNAQFKFYVEAAIFIVNYKGQNNTRIQYFHKDVNKKARVTAQRSGSAMSKKQQRADS